MKDPLTEAYFKKTVQPMIKEKTVGKNLLSHVKGMNNLETNLLKSPCDKQAALLMRNAISNVEKCLKAIKKPEKNLDTQIKTMNTALKKYRDEHNTKIIGKIGVESIGMVPGGLQALKKQGMKEFSPENSGFRAATAKVKPNDEKSMLQVYTKFIGDINLSSANKKSYDTAAKLLKAVMAKADAGLLAKGCKEMYKCQTVALKEIITLQGDCLTRLKADLKL